MKFVDDDDDDDVVAGLWTWNVLPVLLRSVYNYTHSRQLLKVPYTCSNEAVVHSSLFSSTVYKFSYILAYS